MLVLLCSAEETGIAYTCNSFNASKTFWLWRSSTAKFFVSYKSLKTFMIKMSYSQWSCSYVRTCKPVNITLVLCTYTEAWASTTSLSRACSCVVSSLACYVCVTCVRLSSPSKQKVFVHVVDMSKPKEILKFCTDFADSNKPLDILVSCNITASLTGDMRHWCHWLSLYSDLHWCRYRWLRVVPV